MSTNPLASRRVRAATLFATLYGAHASPAQTPPRPTETRPALPSKAAQPPASRPANRGITLLGKASLAADAHDRSGLEGALENGVPQDRLGSCGSGLAWTGVGERYVALSDRGPADGAVGYRSRWHELRIRVPPETPQAVEVELLRTTLLVDETGRNFVGKASAFDTGLRLDPEAVRVARDGHRFVADEYGPLVLEFDQDGRLLRRLPVPGEFAVAHPSADKQAELDGNVRGRMANKGFEGLALTPDGSRLHALLEAPLLQDHGSKGTNCRLLAIDLATGRTRQFAVPLDEPKHCFNELLAVDAHRFLAIERDAESGTKARCKRVVLLDLEGASDVSGVDSLPETGLPAGTRAVTKEVFLDLLDERLGLAGPGFPPKIEGLAFGPHRADGRHLLVVTSDNDFRPEWPSWVWVFAVDAAELPGLVPQVFAADQASGPVPAAGTK